MDSPASAPALLEASTHPCGSEDSGLGVLVSLLVSTSLNLGGRFREWGCFAGHQHGLLLAAIEHLAANHWSHLLVCDGWEGIAKV